MPGRLLLCRTCCLPPSTPYLSLGFQPFNQQLQSKRKRNTEWMPVVSPWFDDAARWPPCPCEQPCYEDISTNAEWNTTEHRHQHSKSGYGTTYICFGLRMKWVTCPRESHLAGRQEHTGRRSPMFCPCQLFFRQAVRRSLRTCEEAPILERKRRDE